MENEIWAPVKNYEGLYQISSHGRIKSLDKSWTNDRGGVCKKIGKMLTPDTSNGYYHIKLWESGNFKWFQVHQLVAMAFIPNPDGKPHVNHLNSDRSDNRVENLEWCTPKENTLHACKVGRLDNINGKKVIDISTGKMFNSCREASDIIGMNYQTLRSYLNGALPNKTSLKYCT